MKRLEIIIKSTREKQLHPEVLKPVTNKPSPQPISDLIPHHRTRPQRHNRGVNLTRRKRREIYTLIRLAEAQRVCVGHFIRLRSHQILIQYQEDDGREDFDGEWSGDVEVYNCSKFN